MIEKIDILQHSEGSFNHEQFGEIRTLTDEQGEPWFVGKDVAKALGYSNCNDALARHVDKEDKGVVNHDTLGLNTLTRKTKKIKSRIAILSVETAK